MTVPLLCDIFERRERSALRALFLKLGSAADPFNESWGRLDELMHNKSHCVLRLRITRSKDRGMNSQTSMTKVVSQFKAALPKLHAPGRLMFQVGI